MRIGLSLCAILVWTGVAEAQVTLNPTPSRIVGHPRLTLSTYNPNYVEGRELFWPRNVTVDVTTAPPILYVSDTGNNRVLGWRNASQFANGAPADVVIGQRDMYSTNPQGPFAGAQLTGGLNTPTGLAVDAGGNLYVADSGNNRVLRFPRPFSQADPVKAPDLVIGQTSLSTRSPNAGGISASTLALNTSQGVFTVSLLFDPQGNLFVTDGGNQRVLRYPAALLGPGAANGPAADLVLGQISFTVSPPQNPENAKDLTRLFFPAGVALDPGGRLFVTDNAHRVLVYEPPLTSGRAAQRFMGAQFDPDGTLPDVPTERSLRTPEAVFVAGNNPFVVDTGNNRILRFDRYEQWPSDVTQPPSARAVIGQADFNSFKLNRDLPEPSNRTLAQPGGAVFAAGELFVADTFNNRILVFPDPTTVAFDFAAQRTLGQEFFHTMGANRVEARGLSIAGRAGMAVDKKSDPPRLYVADTGNNRVLGYRDARKLRPADPADLVIGQPDMLRALANYPSGDPLKPTANSLFQPTGVAVDDQGNLWVADTGNGRILRFPKPNFDQPVALPAANLVLGKADFTTGAADAPDPSPSNMGAPFGLAFTFEGHLLASDLIHNRVLLFLKSGGIFTNGMNAAKVIGQPDFFSKTTGSLEGRFRGPRHIATDTDDRLYVCDASNDRVQIFDRVITAGPDPLPAVVLTSGGQYGRLTNPLGITVSAATGEIWVTHSHPESWAQKFIFRYPRFDFLILNPNPEVTVPTASNSEIPLAVTLDSFGNMLVALSSNRIGIHFPAMTQVNAASYLTRLTPGMIASLFPLGGRFGEETKSFTTVPLPTELADIQVLVNDQPAPLFFVSPGQINFMVPAKDMPTSGNIEIQVVRKSLGQILAVGCEARPVALNPDQTYRYGCFGQPRIDVASPALFAGPGYATGTGQIAAFNRKSSDGSYYNLDSSRRPIPNGPTNPVSRGDFIEMYGTGQGPVPGAPPDGSPPTGAVPTPDRPEVIVNVAKVNPDFVQYSGLAPGLVGVWQLNVKIPDSTPPGDSILVVILHKGIPSNNPQQPGQIRTTIAVKE